MKHYEIPLNMGTVADLIDPPQVRDRSVYHVTALVAKALRKTYSGNAPEGVMAMGRIWEYAARPLVEHLVKSDGGTIEFTVGLAQDGIVGSLDGLASFPSRMCEIWDMKWRWSGIGEDPRHNKSWMHQFRSYCYMAGATRVHIPTVYIDRKSKSPKAEFTLHTVEYTQEELDITWQMILDSREPLAEG